MALNPLVSGSGTSAGEAAAIAFRISSRADTLPPLRAEALLRHLRELALAGPGIRHVRSEDAHQFAEDPVRPGARQHPGRHPGDDALAQGDEAARRQLA